MGVTALGWVNLVLSATMSASSSVSNMAPGNLQSDQCSPSLGWQTGAGVVTVAGGASLRSDWSSAGSTVRAVALVNTNLTPSATVSIALYLAAGPTLVASLSKAGPSPGYRQVIGIFPADQVCDYAIVGIDDPTNPDGHINIGGMFAGPLWIPATGADWNLALGRDSSITEVITRGGQERPQHLWDRRRWNFTLPGIRNSEIWADMQEIDRISRLGNNVLFVPNTASTTLYQEAVYGRLAAAGDMTMPHHNTDRRSWSGKITERL